MMATTRPIVAGLRARSRLYATQPEIISADRAYMSEKLKKHPEVLYKVERVPLPSHEPKISKLTNGAVCVSYENNSPVAKVAVFFNSGPRFENGDDIGISHVIRNAANLSTTESTAFGITRQIQQMGANLCASTTREHNIVTLECMRDQLDEGVNILGHIATCPAYKPWELEAAQERLRLDLRLVRAQPELRLIEALHKAAYRRTLGNSLFCESHRIGTFSSEQLHAYTQKLHVGPNIALVGLGIEHNHFLELCERQLTLSKVPGNVPPKPEAVKYYGGQARINSDSPLVHAAIVTEGADLSDFDFMTIGVLQKILGTGPRVKYSTNTAAARLSKAAARASLAPTAACCINANYAHSGLFGFHVVGHYKDMEKIMTIVTKEYANIAKEGAFSEEELKRGKALFKGTMHLELESNQGLVEAFGKQAAIAGELFEPPKDVDPTCDKVTLEDIYNVAQKLTNTKYTMAAVGNLSHTPELEDLMELVQK